MDTSPQINSVMVVLLFPTADKTHQGRPQRRLTHAYQGYPSHELPLPSARQTFLPLPLTA